ncbi:MAG: UbiA family prenyltransferase [Deltaproteobacteria bacterium]|nr:UbiA family prenyltransferase [Deltaproteobacteria bacterium]
MTFAVDEMMDRSVAAPSPAPAFMRGLARSGVFIATTAVSFVMLASLLFGESLSIVRLVAVGALATSSYGIDRILDEARRGRGGAELARLGCGAAGIFVVAVMLLWVSGHGAAAVAAAIFPASVLLYSLPLLPKARAFRRIKDLPFAKAFYAAFVWALLVVFAAAISDRGSAAAVVCALAIFVFVKTAIGVVASDIKDVRFDSMDGVRSFPVAFGAGATLTGLAVAAIAGVLLTGTFVLFDVLPPWMLLADAHGIVVASLLLLMRSRRTYRQRWLISEIALDASYMLIPVLAFAGAIR